MMQVGTNQSTTYHSQPSISTSGGQTGRSSSTSRQQQQQQSQYDNEQLANIRPRLCILRKWPYYDGYGVHLARNQHWLGLRIGDVEPNSPAESGGLLREDVVLAVNGHSVENDDFFVILSFIQHELEDDQIRFLVLDPHNADLARRNHINIDENYRTCVRMETPPSTVSPEKLLYDQWRSANHIDPTAAQNIVHLGPTSSINQNQTNTNTQRYQQLPPQDGRDDVYTFLPYSDTNTNLRPEPRLCSLALRPGKDTIGITLQPDKDFGHIIKYVEPNSPADRAGIERDDCILSLNDIPMLNIPYEDVLNILKTNRNEPNLDFLVAKKSYLLKSHKTNATLGNIQNDTSGKYIDPTLNTSAEVMPSSNISERNNTSTAVPPTEALEELYKKYNTPQKSSFDEQKNKSNRPRETVSTTTTTIINEKNDQRSPPLDDNRYSSKQQGQILQGVGPATADRSSWGVSSGKSTDDLPAPISGNSSIRSTSRSQQPETDDTKGRSSSLEDSFKPLQVGITNPTPASEQRDSSPKVLPSPDTVITSTPVDTTSLPSSKENQSIQNLQKVIPIAPVPIPSTIHNEEQEPSQTTPSTQSDIRLATMQLSELPNYGYELHNIQLMQPTETSPVGLKLTKQQDPLQYIITAVAKGTKADLAGLKVNDWLIKIEDNDIRLVEFAEVSQDIRQLLTNAGLINMVIARKKTSTSSPLTKQVEKQKTPSSSRSDSLSRQQGGQIPTSLLTTDITRDTPDNSQVRFIPDQSTSPPTTRSQRSPISNRETNVDAPGGPLSVGLTNPIPDENLTKSPRSQSRSPNRSPTREYTINQQQKPFTTDQTPDDIDQNEIRHVVLKEALGLDFNSFIPEGDSQVQTHFISNVQPSSMADKAGLRDGDRILTVNGVDVTNSIHEDVRRMMQSKKPLKLSVVNDPKYLELIENVKRNQNKIEDTTSRTRPPMKTAGSDSSSELNVPYPKFESPKAIHEDLSKYLSILFTDNEGPVQIKHCLLKKDPNYNGYGLLLRYQNGLHLIDQVEEGSPAYNAGLREDDVILYVDKKNVEQMTHDDVKILIRKLSLSNTNIDLILIKKHDIQRYKIYQERNSIDWKPIFQDKLSNEIVQTEQQEPSVIRSSNDQTSNPRKSSSSSGKQQAPAPPTSSTIQSILPSGTRVCILQPSADRTAGFALSGKSPPPYIICQIEKNSPAEKAGLLLNDALLSINGKSVTDKSYEDTVKLVKEALQQKSVELVVQDRTKMGTQSSSIDPTKLSMDSNDSNNVGNNSSIGVEPSRQGTNAVEEYQTDYEAPPKTTISSKARAPSPPTVRVGHNRLDVPNVSQSLDTVASNTTSAPVSSIHDTVRSTISTGSFDYLRGPRRCVLKVDRNKGLGFVLSATGDYDHTITAVEKYSAADIAGLQVNDEVLEVDGVDVRSVKYEQVVEMLVSAMRINESIEMRVSDGRSRDVYPSKIDVDKQTDPNSLLNTNNNNNTTITTTTIYSQRTTAISGDDLSDINSSISPFDSFNQQKIATSYPNLPGQLRQFDTVTNRGLSGSVPVLATGITAASSAFHQTKSISTSSEKGSVTRLSDISTQDAPVARLCRIRKFATSPFYGFFLCGDPKKLGRVFISDVTKHSPAAVCGLRDGDRIIEINGITIDTLTYETILDKIKQHMGHDDLELLVLDKKAVHWYRERNYPITSRTLPTIVHIEPIINDGSSETQLSEIPATHTKLVGFADRRVSKTGL